MSREVSRGRVDRCLGGLTARRKCAHGAYLLPDRGTPAPQLMKCVRLPLLSRDFLLGHVDAESLVRHHPDCKDLLIEALKFHLLPEQRGVLGTSRTRPRRCEGAGPVLFAVGMPACLVPTSLPSPFTSVRPVLSTSRHQPIPLCWSHPAPAHAAPLSTSGGPHVVCPTQIPVRTLGAPAPSTLSCARAPQPMTSLSPHLVPSPPPL